MKKSLVTVACLLAAGSTFADTGVGLKLGTLGLGLDVTRPLTQTLNIRGNVNFLDVNRSLDESGIDYDADLDLKSVGALLDWHPWQGGFRASAGVYYNKNGFDMRAKPSAGSTINLGGQQFDLGTQVQSVDANLKFKKTAPYVGIGWGNAALASNTWSFVVDLGVLYQQKPSASLTATCGAQAPEGSVACNQIRAQAATEQAELRDSVKDFKWYPVVAVGAAYRF